MRRGNEDEEQGVRCRRIINVFTLKRSREIALYVLSTKRRACICVAILFLACVATPIWIVSAGHIFFERREYNEVNAMSERTSSLLCPWAKDNIDVRGRSFAPHLCHEPIDVVYTWVNGSDPVWLESFQKYSRDLRGEEEEEEEDGDQITHADFVVNATEEEEVEEDGAMENRASKNRYRDNQELRYSLRSLEKFAPWVRRVFIVTDNQIPYWLDESNPRITVVTHEEIFPSKSMLPVFSSPAIETQIHRIPGLAEKFIYFNDDVFLGAPVWPDDFVTSTGQKIYYSWDVPKCTENCNTRRLGDGVCDLDCNVSRCAFDVGDCIGDDVEVRETYHSSSNSYGGSDVRNSECNPGCRPHWIGDKVCDNNCKTASCAYDAPDCGMDMVHEAQRNGTIGSLALTRVEWERHVRASTVADDDANNTSYLSATIDPRFGAIAIDLSDVLSEVNVAEHNNEDGIFASVVAYTERALVVVYNDKREPDASMRTTLFRLSGKDVNDVPTNVTFVVARHVDERRGGNASKSEAHRAEESVANTTRDVRDDNRTAFLISPSSPSIVTNDTSLLTSIRVQDAAFVETEQGDGRSERRRLADYYGDSLVNVNNLYTQDFGPVKTPRKVPAHMPHFIRVSDVKRMQSRYSSHFRATASNRFRSSDDVQYAFAYFHFLINSARSLDFRLEDFWSDVVDSNGDGKLSDNEIRTAAAIAANSAPSDSEIEEATRCLRRGTTREEEWEAFDGTVRATYAFRPHATFSSLQNCTELMEKLKENAPRFFEPIIVDDPDRYVAFEMIDDDIDVMRMKLDSVRARRPKFVCINDDMKHPTEAHETVLRNFYESFFARRSQFELPEGTRNERLRLDELRRSRHRHGLDVHRALLVAVSSIGLVACVSAAWVNRA